MIPDSFRLQVKDVVTSTNDLARMAGQTGEESGLVIQALEQTAGRGRQGRVWSSPRGNMYVSLLLRPAVTVRSAGAYSFVASLAVFDTVKAFLPAADVVIKWPNDVLVGGKKISGLLLETGAPDEEKNIPWLVVGVGINVVSCPAQALYPTTSLAGEGGEASLDAVVACFLKAFAFWDQMLQTEGFGAIRAAWRDRAKTGEMTARLPDEVVQGQFVRLDEEGHLILRLADGAERAIAAGDLFFPDTT